MSIKMPSKESPLFKFIMDALMDATYPSSLYWINRDEGKFCLKCIFKSNKNWTPLNGKIFEDYHELKPRKSNDKRQRFLVAMQACPFITHLKDISTREEKYYEIHTPSSSVSATDEIAALSTLYENADMQVADTCQGGLLAVSATDEIGTVSLSNKDMETFQVTCTSEDGLVTGATSMENYVCNSQSENDVGNYSSSLLVDDISLPGDIAELLSSLEDSGVDLTVPDVVANGVESPENGASFSDYSVDLMRRTTSCKEILNASDQFHFPAEEMSYSFHSREGSGDFPPDYDPEKDFIQSLGAPKLAEMEGMNPFANPKFDSDQLLNAQMIPSTSEASSQCEFEGVFKIDDNDAVVQHLRQNRGSDGDNHGKQFYMMVLKPKTMYY